MDKSEMQFFRAGKKICRARADGLAGTGMQSNEIRVTRSNDICEEEEPPGTGMGMVPSAGTALVPYGEGGMLGKEFHPLMRCDGCAYQGNCPLFKSGYECGYGHILERIRLGTQEERDTAKRELAEIQVKRAVISSIHETNSGSLSDELGSRIEKAIRVIESLDERRDESPVPARSILQQIFAFGGNAPVMGPPEVKVDVTDATFEINDDD